MLPKSEAGQAIAYTLKNWTALTRYCSDGDLSIDNNATERSLRSFAVGRNVLIQQRQAVRPHDIGASVQNQYRKTAVAFQTIEFKGWLPFVGSYRTFLARAERSDFGGLTAVALGIV